MLKPLLLTVCLFGTLLATAQTFNGSVTINSQADLDAFQLFGMPYRTITGNLNISDANGAITDYRNLRALEEVRNALTINNLNNGNNRSVIDFPALDRLGTFGMVGNSVTLEVNFPDLRTVNLRGIVLSGNGGSIAVNMNRLESLSNEIQLIGGAAGNALNLNLGVASNPLTINGSVEIVGTDRQQVLNLFAFSNCTITGSLITRGDDRAQCSIDLPKLSRVDGSVLLRDILGGLDFGSEVATFVGGNMFIQNNDLLNNPVIGELFCDENLVIVDNNSIAMGTNLTVPVSFVRWNLELRSDPRGASVQVNFPILEYVGVSIEVDGFADGILSFPALTTLRREDFIVQNCTNLAGIQTGPNFTTIPRDLIFQNNQGITTLAGFSDLTDIGRSAVVINNPTLSRCCLFACQVDIDGIPADQPGASISLFNNQPGCNTIRDVQQVCEWDVTSDFATRRFDFRGRATFQHTIFNTGIDWTFAWTVNGRPFGGDSPRISVTPLSLPYTVCVTAANACEVRSKSCQTITSRTFKSEKEAAYSPGKSLSASTSAIGVFPNPFTEELNVSLDLASKARVQVDIFDLAGRRVERSASSRDLAAGPNRFTITTAGLKPGGYLVRITDADGNSLGVFQVIRQ